MPLNASARLVAVGVSSAWLMLAKMPRSSKIFQHFLGAHVEFFRQIADRDAFGDRDFARRARRRRGSALDLRGAALAGTHARANRMQLALALFKALLHRGPRARGGLALVDRLAGLRLWRSLVRRQQRAGAAAGTRRTRSLVQWLAGTPRNRLPGTALCPGRAGNLDGWPAGPRAGRRPWRRRRIHARAGRQRIPIRFGSRRLRRRGGRAAAAAGFAAACAGEVAWRAAQQAAAAGGFAACGSLRWRGRHDADAAGALDDGWARRGGTLGGLRRRSGPRASELPGRGAGAAGFASTALGGAAAGRLGSAATGAGGAESRAAAGGGAATAGFMRAALAAASFAALSAICFLLRLLLPLRPGRGKCLRTFTAASTSIELECVFFSVTPASGK